MNSNLYMTLTSWIRKVYIMKKNILSFLIVAATLSVSAIPAYGSTVEALEVSKVKKVK